MTEHPKNQAPLVDTSLDVDRHRSLSKPECKADVYRPEGDRWSFVARALGGEAKE